MSKTIITINSVKYTIIKELGENKKDDIKIYKAINKINNKYFAIKEISIKNEKEDVINEIQKEAKILSQFNSENIVKYYGSQINKNNFYILMEYCDGHDLRTFINKYKEKNEFIEENIIYDLINQICFALKEIHDKNITHRDLKPENIFMNKNNRIKIGDFGVSKQLNSFKTLISTKYGAGTVLYNSPEVIKFGKYNKKTDIWSLGCIIYELFNLSIYFLDKYDEVKTIDKEIYNIKWQELINLLLQVDVDKRPDINQVLEYINMHFKDKFENNKILLNEKNNLNENYEIFEYIKINSNKYLIEKEIKKDIKDGIIVYQVINDKDNKIYIIKEISLKNNNKIMIYKLLEEIDILIKLNNDKIVKYYEYSIYQNYLYILIEYFDGQDLISFMNQYKEKNKNIEEKVIFDILKQICLAIKSIQALDIIIKDINSENIYINQDKIIKLEIENLINNKINNVISEEKELLIHNMRSLGFIIYELLTFKNFKFLNDLEKINANIYNIGWKKLLKSLLQLNNYYIVEINKFIIESSNIKEVIKKLEKNMEIKIIKKDKENKPELNKFKEENKINFKDINKSNNINNNQNNNINKYNCNNNNNTNKDNSNNNNINKVNSNNNNINKYNNNNNNINKDNSNNNNDNIIISQKELFNDLKNIPKIVERVYFDRNENFEKLTSK